MRGQAILGFLVSYSGGWIPALSLRDAVPPFKAGGTLPICLDPLPAGRDVGHPSGKAKRSEGLACGSGPAMNGSFSV